MPIQDSKPSDEIHAAYEHLIARVRTGVLLTLRNGHPFGSHVPYLLGADWSCAYLHLSRLALHAHHLLEDSRVSLFIAEPDEPGKNPLALQRLNLQGTARLLPVDHESYESIKLRYLTKFPQSKMMFGFGDFALWELHMRDAHLVLGFGQAYQADAAAPNHWHHQTPDKRP